MANLPIPNSPADLPSPPFYHISGIANFRDIGGYAASTSTSSTARSIRQGLVFRSADPSRIQPDGLEKLKELGIGKVFDLRSTPEIKRQGPEWAGVEAGPEAFATRNGSEDAVGDDGSIERVWCPVFTDEEYGPEQVGVRFQQYATGSEGFVKAYEHILAHAPSAYRTILAHIAQPTPLPCIIHCTAGKDRTGMLVALMYLLCGVDPETVCREYSLTDDGLRLLKPLYLERLLKNPVFKGNEESVKQMISSDANYMRATIKLIEKIYGSAEKYFIDNIGLDEEAVARLKQNLLSEETPLFSR